MKSKIISIFLTAAMFFSANVPVFAENTINSEVDISENTAINADDGMTAFDTVDIPNVQESPKETEKPVVTATPDITAIPKTTATPKVTESPKATTKPKKDSVILVSLLSDDTTDLSQSFKDASVTIDQSGSYTISDVTTTTNTIIIKANTNVNLTLKDVSITSSKTSPILIETGAVLTLTLEGENVLNANASYFPGIAVMATASEYSQLFIEGKGQLDITTTNGQSEGIGTVFTSANITPKSTGIHGEITINDGILNINAAKSTAIGVTTAQGTRRGYDITINGGNIIAKGYQAGIGVSGSGAGAARCANIIINGGTVTASGSMRGIGGNKPNADSGSVTINGGNVTATSTGANSSAIQSINVVTINGGNITAKGAGVNSSGINISSPSDAKIEINGGSINASGTNKMTSGSTSTIKTLTPVNKYDSPLIAVDVSIPGLGNTEVGLGSGKSTTADDGSLLCYIPDNTKAFYVTYTDDQGKQVIYYTNDIFEEGGNELILYDGPPCSCNEDSLEAVVDLPDTIIVNRLEGEKTETLSARLEHPDCTFPIHEYELYYELTYTDGSDVDSQTAYIDGNQIVIKYNAKGKTIRVHAVFEINGMEIRGVQDITVQGDDVSKFDLSQGNITIGSDKLTNDPDMMCVTVSTPLKTDKYILPRSDEVTIYQSSSSATSYNVHISIDASVILDNVNIQTNNADVTSGYTLKLDDNLTATVSLTGNNKMLAKLCKAIMANDTSNLIIKGEGSLDVTSNSAAAISGMDTLTINGGTITAKGGNGGAGIGGDSHNAKGINVIVNGGRVYATGDGSAAGIGGGENGAGGSFIINGGMVNAQSGSSAGNGIGDGGSPRNPGTITINGGSVNAVLPNRDGTYYNANLSYVNKPQYLLVIQPEGITGQQNITYTIDESSPIMTSTDSEGKLYLYPDKGQRWIRIYSEGKTYYRYLTVNADKTEKEIAVLNPVPKLKTFEIAGQIGETTIDETNHTVNVTVPYNILLDSIEPIYTYDGAVISDNTTLDFSNDAHTATLTILGDDKNEKNYTITLTLASEPENPQAEVLDISKGNIWITDNYVTYGGVKYSVNPKGYIITGTAADNVVIVNNIDGGTIPPITFRDLSMTNNSTIPLRFNTAADVTIEGDCVIKTNNSYALRCEKGEHGNTAVNITGEGRLFINSASNCCYIDSQSTASINLPVTSIVSDRRAADGNGEIIFNSDAYVKFAGITDSNIRAVNSQGDALYQITAHIDTTGGTGNECVYNKKVFYLDDNKDICLMVPDGQYTMSVEYDNSQFDGTAEINGAPVNVTLKTMTVEKVEYDNSQIPFTGKDVDFTITTSSVPEGTPVKVVLTPDKETAEILTADAIYGSDGRYTTTITIPENESTTERIRYTVSVFLDKKEFIQNLKLVINVNNSVARITEFNIDGQMGDTVISDENKMISVYFPYDYEFEMVPNSNPKRYKVKPSKLEFIGGSIDHDENETVEFVEDVNGYLRSYYYVTAANNETTRYTVRLYYRPTPKITQLRFNNTLTSEGGTVTVTASGQSTNYIQLSANEDNKKVYIYSDDGISPVEAEQVMVDNGAGAMVATFVADITIPENTDDTQDKVYVLKAKIGSTEQKAVGTLTVKRKAKANANLKSFALENQILSSISGTNALTILMPYDADITNLVPDIETEDVNASYYPTSGQDFTNPVTYTITAEDNITTKTYIITVNKQPEPVVTEVEFKNPSYSSAGRVEFKLKGQNLESSLNALAGSDCIDVICTPVGGGNPISTKAKQTEDGDFTAIITIPSNTETTNAVYNVTVYVGEKSQTLTGNTTLTVPGKEPDSCELTDIILADNQGVPTINGNEVNVLVPYNTDLNSITPVITHTGTDYSPKTAQNFNQDVKYTISAPSGKTKEFTIHTYRSGQAGVFNIDAGNSGKLTSYAPKNVDIKIFGNFVPYLTSEDKLNGNFKDKITMNLTPKNGGEPIEATIEYNKYSGEAIGHIASIPPNETSEDVQYVANVTLNGISQDLGFSNIITVPHRKTCTIKRFMVENQIGLSVITNISENESTISFNVPYETELDSIEPEIQIDADSITPTGAQNFENPVEYTVSSEGMPDHKYTVTANRYGSPLVNSVIMTDSPSTYTGGEVDVTIEGIFHNSIKVKAVPDDGSETIEGIVTMTEKNKASAIINIPANTSHSDRTYTLVFNLDDYGEETYSDYVITLPRKKTCTITEFKVGNQIGTSVITDISENESTISLIVPYEMAINSIEPEIKIDADSITPTGAQNFENPVEYTVSADGMPDHKYMVTVNRDGSPSVSSITMSDSPSTSSGGTVNVAIEGLFNNSVKVKAVPNDGSETIEGIVTMTEKNKATAVINIPANTSHSDRKYTLVLNLDDCGDETYSDYVITLPRKKTCTITDFKVGNQIGTSVITDISENESIISFSVPYEIAINSIEPEIQIDADSITPTGAQNFENPVEYTVLADGMPDHKYTVTARRVGSSSVSSITMTDSPSTNRGGAVNVAIEGVFNNSVKVKAVPDDGSETIEGIVTMTEKNKASAVINIPANTSHSDRKYTLVLNLDDCGDETYSDYVITLPRKKTCTITEFKIENQIGTSVITDVSENESTISFTVPYEMEVNSIEPEIKIDADSITPTGAQNFENPVEYTVTADSMPDHKYIVTANRSGSSSVSSITMTDSPSTNKGGEVNVTIEGIFYNSVKVKAVPDDGSETIEGIVTMTEKNKASAVINIPANTSYSKRTYTLVLNLDDCGDETYSDYVITLPKRTRKSRKNTSTPSPTPSVTDPEPTETPAPLIKPYINGYEEGGNKLFKPENNMIRAEVATILSKLDSGFDEDTIYSGDLYDVPDGSWYANYMKFAVLKGYLSGYDDDTYRPDNMITRAEFAAMIARYIDISSNDVEDKFNDLEGYDWCRQQINALADMGIISGYGNGEFKPNNFITRAEAVAIINRALEREMSDELIDEIICPFIDVSSEHWAYNDIITATQAY